MNKFFILLLGTTALQAPWIYVFLHEMNTSDTQTNNSNIIEAQKSLPLGSQIIKQYKSPNSDAFVPLVWTKWKLENNCFLSMQLGFRTGVLTSIPCDDESK